MNWILLYQKTIAVDTAQRRSQASNIEPIFITTKIARDRDIFQRTIRSLGPLSVKCQHISPKAVQNLRIVIEDVVTQTAVEPHRPESGLEIGGQPTDDEVETDAAGGSRRHRSAGERKCGGRQIVENPRIMVENVIP